jgi:hypothetical protein
LNPDPAETRKKAALATLPQLEVKITSVETTNSCLAAVEAHVWSLIDGRPTFSATGQAARILSAEMWRSSTWIRVGTKDITKAVKEVSIEMMGDFIDEWTRASRVPR